MKKYFTILFISFSILLSQSEQPYPPINLISIPTAGTMPRGFFSFENTFMNEGSILPKFSIGITDNFMLGVSFGISNFIGDGNMKKNRSYPEVQIKYRIFDETDKIPAILIGIDTQDSVPCSGKTGEGIDEILENIIKILPPPKGKKNELLKSLLVDSWYDSYLGVVILVRVIDGKISKNMKIKMMSNKQEYLVEKVGIFTPKPKKC